MRTEPEAFDVLPDGSGERTVVLGCGPSGEDVPLCDSCGDEHGELEVTIDGKVYWVCSDCAAKLAAENGPTYDEVLGLLEWGCCDVCGGEDNVKPRAVSMVLCGECGTRVERVERLLKAMKGGA